MGKSFEEFAREFEQKEKLKNHYKKLGEYGKLGGRPKVLNKKNKVVGVRMTTTEDAFISQKAKEYNLSKSEFSRLRIFDREFPNKERDLLLLEYRSNFNRISNLIKTKLFNQTLQSEFLREIKKVVELIDKYLKG